MTKIGKSLVGRLRPLFQMVSVIGILLMVLMIRVVSSAKNELLEADLLLAKGEIDAAIVHYRRASRWYAPGSPYHVEGLIKLSQIARRSEQQGDVRRALTAYRSIRAAIMSSRSLYTPESHRLEFANLRIAELMASLPVPPIDVGKSHRRLRDEHLAMLKSCKGPDVLWTCVLLLGFLGWIIGAFIFSVRAIDEDDHLVWSEVRRWGTIIVLGFGLFVLGLVFA